MSNQIANAFPAIPRTDDLVGTFLALLGVNPYVRIEGSAAGGHYLLLKEDETNALAVIGSLATGSARAISIQTDGTERLRIETSRFLLSGCSFNLGERGTALVVTANNINPTRSNHLVKTDDGAKTIKTINPASRDGDLLILSINSANDCVFDNTGGAGGLRLPGGTQTLSNPEDRLMLHYDSTLVKWCALGAVSSNT